MDNYSTDAASFEERERRRENDDPNEGKRSIAITLTVDGNELTRRFSAYKLSDIDWNPQINDMADALDDSAEPV